MIGEFPKEAQSYREVRVNLSEFCGVLDKDAAKRCLEDDKIKGQIVGHLLAHWIEQRPELIEVK